MLAVAAMIMVAMSCAAISKADKEVYEKAQAEIVRQARYNHNLTIEINRISPSGLPQKVSNDGYKLSVKDGVANAQLPFIGTSRIATGYGTEPAGIEFDNFPVRIYEDNSKAAKGRYVWHFEARSGSDPVKVTITFWDNGAARISCISTNRSNMEYSGNLVPDHQR